MRMVPEPNVTRGIRGQKLFGVLRAKREREEGQIRILVRCQLQKFLLVFRDAGEKCCLSRLSWPRQKLIDDLASRKKRVRGNVQGFDLLFLGARLGSLLNLSFIKGEVLLVHLFSATQPRGLLLTIPAKMHGLDEALVHVHYGFWTDSLK